ncbi:alpha/beta fold hydrolase [Shinella sp.]|uniref:alpha/beta fold hydrolase n=1 Tax=Shinella sp. TaxID=1870904 RepID=UPI0039E4380E
MIEPERRGKACPESRPLLLLLPGLLCDDATWQSQVEALSAMADCVVASHGMADSIEAMARQALHLMPSGQSFNVAGHSMGGRCALEIARMAPERVERLALLDTGYQARVPGASAEAEAAQRMELLDLARRDGMRAMGRQWARGMVHADQWDSAVFENILDMVGRFTIEQFEAQIRALLDRPDATQLLPTIRVPTLLVCGREDAWSPPARHEQMQLRIPGARLEIIGNCGHMSTMEQPRAVSQAMANWLASGSTQ